jgi:hypothetical protein
MGAVAKLNAVPAGKHRGRLRPIPNRPIDATYMGNTQSLAGTSPVLIRIVNSALP